MTSVIIVVEGAVEDEMRNAEEVEDGIEGGAEVEDTMTVTTGTTTDTTMMVEISQRTTTKVESTRCFQRA